MRVRAFIAAAIIAALTGPGLAQQAPVQRYGEKDKEKTYNEKEQEKEAERAYQRSLGSVPEKGPVDPWGNARSVGDAEGRREVRRQGRCEGRAAEAEGQDR